MLFMSLETPYLFFPQCVRSDRKQSKFKVRGDYTQTQRQHACTQSEECGENVKDGTQNEYPVLGQAEPQ